jgi:hypothetical protein
LEEEGHNACIAGDSGHRAGIAIDDHGYECRCSH